MKKALAKAATDNEKSVRIADEAQTAEYIADLVTELEHLARGQGMVQLQYLLGACREEARRISAGGKAA